MKNPIKAVVFDFFGVVCSDLSALTSAAFCKRHGIKPVELSRLVDLHRDALDLGHMSQLEFAAAIQQRWDLSATVEQIAQELDALDGQYYSLDHHLHDLILALKPHVTVALMSNVSRDEGAYLRSLGAYDIFDHVYLSGDYGLTKDDGAWFDKVAADLDCAPSEILLIDDVQANVDTAQQAGWLLSLAYHNPSQLIQDLNRMGLTTTLDR